MPPAPGHVAWRSAELSAPPTPFPRSARGRDGGCTGHLRGPGGERGVGSIGSDLGLGT